MTREEITNSQDYKAEGIALDWYKSLNAESVGEIHITDAYADGVIYGWNNPQWIPVEERKPEVGEKVIFYSPDLDDWLSGAIQSDGRWWSEEYASHFTDVPLWMKPQLPRKEE